jgi:hypothetical protein
MPTAPFLSKIKGKIHMGEGRKVRRVVDEELEGKRPLEIT